MYFCSQHPAFEFTVTKYRCFVVIYADGGYYLFPECPVPAVTAIKLLTLNTTEEEDDDISVSLMNWW